MFRGGAMRAIVTGGASGLGAATATRLVAAGYQTWSLDVAPSDASAIADAQTGGVHQIGCDVGDPVSVARAFALATRADDGDGDLRVVVACAGRLCGALLYDDEVAAPHPPEIAEDLIRTNVLGTFFTLRQAAAAMAGNRPDDRDERGVVVLTGSIAAEDGQIGQVAYAASKGAIAAMSLPAARELARYRIRVVTIAPGMFDTAMVRALPPHTVRQLHRHIVHPAGLGDPATFASLVMEIIRNGYLNGSVLRLDAATRLGVG